MSLGYWFRRRPRLCRDECPRRRRRAHDPCRGRGPALRRDPGFFDSKLDVALLYSSQLRAPALPLSPTDPERGAIGATFGFPGGGGLDVQPAAVAGAYEATGRDIYGKTRVTRSILEIRAEIDQGDSGGPLVLTDGTIGGVVFAEARTDEEVGYALTPSSVADAIAPALDHTGNVNTGACIH